MASELLSLSWIEDARSETLRHAETLREIKSGLSMSEEMPGDHAWLRALRDRTIRRLIALKDDSSRFSI